MKITINIQIDDAEIVDKSVNIPWTKDSPKSILINLSKNSGVDNRRHEIPKNTLTEAMANGTISDVKTLKKRGRKPKEKPAKIIREKVKTTPIISTPPVRHIDIADIKFPPEMPGSQAFKRFICSNTYFKGDINEARAGYIDYLTAIIPEYEKALEGHKPGILSWVGYLTQIWNKKEKQS